jgi:hypothetical protein
MTSLMSQISNDVAMDGLVVVFFVIAIPLQNNDGEIAVKIFLVV